MSSCVAGGDHCWHATGLSHVFTNFGKDEHICCNCGHQWWRPWELIEETKEGHGPYYKIKVKHRAKTAREEKR